MTSSLFSSLMPLRSPRANSTAGPIALILLGGIAGQRRHLAFLDHAVEQLERGETFGAVEGDLLLVGRQLVPVLQEIMRPGRELGV